MKIFEILFLSLVKYKNASDSEIKKAHRKMVAKYHPDKLQGVSQDIIKLAECSGTNPSLDCVPLKNPFPKKPPDPKAIFDCIR